MADKHIFCSTFFSSNDFSTITNSHFISPHKIFILKDITSLSPVIDNPLAALNNSLSVIIFMPSHVVFNSSVSTKTAFHKAEHKISASYALKSISAIIHHQCVFINAHWYAIISITQS